MTLDAESIYEQILPVFLADTGEALATMEQALLVLEAEPKSAASLDEVFRVLHTLKGDAGSLGFSHMATMSHQFEEALEAVREQRRRLDPEGVSLLLRAVDVLRQSLVFAKLRENRLAGESEGVLERIKGWVAGRSGMPHGPESGPEPVAEMASPLQAERARTLRVDTGKLDSLLNLVGEIAVARGSFAERLEASAHRGSDLLAHHRDADRLYGELQELVMKLRMVPVGPVLQRFARLLRELSRSLHKRVRLVIEGGQVELDNSVVQLLRDPLSHLLRNAVVHGIEPPEQREASGKNPAGTIILRTRQEGGAIVLTVLDDGQGIDRERVIGRGRELGLVGRHAAPADAELYPLLFLPGFSTAPLSDLAGRGVGLDVVKQSIEALRGSVEVGSEPGKGTWFRIRLPLTLAIVEGLVVAVAGQSYVLPIESVIELVDLASLRSSRAAGVLDVRGQILPLIRLREVFEIAGQRPEDEVVAVLDCAEGRVALVVDRVVGKSQVVIKPVAKLFEGVPAIAGSAVLGNGRVVLILDVPGLLKTAERRSLARV